MTILNVTDFCFLFLKNFLIAQQLYYCRHLDPSESPDQDDLEALQAIHQAKSSFDSKLGESFKKALGEIKGLGYPGFNDPEIRLSCKIEPVENLNHAAAVQFDIQKQGEKADEPLLSLPERYNGLGYKNLIDMVFRLIGFRDQWMREGKAGKRRTEKDASIEPLHLVFIEEPEAHLHVQVQQVFIRKAYDVLRNHEDLEKQPSKFTTQLIVSTHSSCVAHEVGFEKLRYFKRNPATSSCCIPLAETVDLSETFGSPKKRTSEADQTAKFVARYLKTTHCDLFFANGIILVEGAAERILLPHFIRYKYDDSRRGLNRNYISILEVGGAHAHRLRPLIEKLGVPTLVITDTDAVDAEGKKVRPKREKNYTSNSDTLKDWFGLKDKSLDEVLGLPDEDKVKDYVRVAYQYGIQMNFKEEDEEAIPYTFEDAMALSNMELFRELERPTGMIRKMQAAFSKETLDDCCKDLFEALTADKAKMALDLLFDADPECLTIPKYIQEGLDWLESELELASQDFHSTTSCCLG
jgi:predicted ATP-dependent endonuclease of OLD family